MVDCRLAKILMSTRNWLIVASHDDLKVGGCEKKILDCKTLKSVPCSAGEGMA